MMSILLVVIVIEAWDAIYVNTIHHIRQAISIIHTSMPSLVPPSHSLESA